MKRRRFLQLAGGGILLAATAGAAGFVATRKPGAALEPWNISLSVNDDPRLVAASYGILAPNPHNRQPWLVHLEGRDSLVLLCDLKRRLPHTDPFDRQILIGLGCFLELLAIAAAELGYRVDLDLFPEGAPAERLDSRAIARAVFVKDEKAVKDPLFAQVLRRRSNKEPFDTSTGVSNNMLMEVANSRQHGVQAFYSNNKTLVLRLRELTWKAHNVETYTPRTLKESIELMRIGKKEIEANPDGIDLGGPFMELLKMAGILDRHKMLDQNSEVFKKGLDHYEGLLFSAMAYVWMVTPGNSRAEQVAAGRDYVRQNLTATALGLGFHPISQALQEYGEMQEVSQELQQVLGIPRSSKLQMLARVGHGPRVPASPRWSLETRLT